MSRTLLLAGHRLMCGVWMACVGCVGELSLGTEEELADPPESVPYGLPSDITLAQDLWSGMASFETWAPFDGLDGFQTGHPAHATFQKHSMNSIASSNVETFGNGSIIMSRNYSSEDESSLISITVIRRITGYNSPEGDWFWAKFNPAGQLLVDEQNVSLAGRIGAGDEMGCIGCHAGAPGSDFVFSNALRM